MRPKAVVFDLDGTLVDTAEEFVTAAQVLRAQHGLQPMPADQIRRSVSNGSGKVVTVALGIEPGQWRYERRRREFLDLYESGLGETAAPYPGLVDLVQDLYRAGVAWGVATNKPRRFAAPLMAKMPFDPAPGALLTPCDVNEAKPHPESIYASCSQLGVRPEDAIYVGDHQRDIYAGNAAGCYTIAAAYGYLEVGDDPEDWGADMTVSTPFDLADNIRAMLK